MKDRPSEQERLQHIIEAIDRIFRFREALSYQQFLENEMAQYAIIKCFEIIGEAAYQIPKGTREQHDQIEWRKIIAFRHILVHDYHKVNMEVVWNAIENKLPDLRARIEELSDE